MSFGFSVGDFFAVIQFVNKVRKDYVSAPDQFRQISNELGRLENTTRDIEVLLSARDLSPVQEKRLKEITEDCRLILKDAQGTVDKHSTLKSRGTSIEQKATRLWNRLKWEPDDVHDLRGRIALIVTSCTFFVVMLNGENAVKLLEGQDQQEQREQKREHQYILDWLTPVNYSTQQSDFISRRQPGTGQWLLDSPEYQQWVATRKESLFCPGIPGAGKTILSSIVVDNLLDLHRADESVGICYIFLNFRRNEEQKLCDLIASLLKQLAQTKPTCSESVKVLYDQHQRRHTRPSFRDLCDALHSVVAEYSRVFMVIDALDECQTGDDGCQSIFIKELLNLWSNFAVNILATSRPIPEIKYQFECPKEIEIRASDHDIIKYLDGKLPCLPGFVIRDQRIWAEIKQRIVECVDGMFLLAQLYLDSFRGKRSLKAVRNILSNLAKGSEAYDPAYHDAMSRIHGQLQDQKDLALQSLLWITSAKRPLTTMELRHALGVELNTTDFDEDNLPDLEDMVSYCCGLVTIDEESDIIRLVHYTAQEYFNRTGETWFPDAQSQIAETCVTYLSYDAFKSGPCKDFELKMLLSSYPLYEYACRYWGIHAYLAPNYQFCYTFLTMTSNVSAWAQQFSNGSNLDWRLGGGISRHMTGHHAAAYFGLYEVVKRLVDVYEINMRDSLGRTPIFYAITNEHSPVVELFLEKGVHVDSKVEGTPLLPHAADNGHESIVRLLLERGADIESKDNKGRTPLSNAVIYGSKATIQLLLERGANIESKDKSGCTPLSNAIIYERKAAIQLLLLERGANIESKDKNGCTPLFNAIIYGSKAAIQLLLERGANIESNDDRGWTPLRWAFGYEFKDIAQLLLEKGAIKYWEK